MISQKNSPFTRNNFWLPLLDILALLAWSILLLRYWLTDKLYLLIHPNYFGLTVAGAIVLLLITGGRAWQLGNLWQKQAQGLKTVPPPVPHVTLFPPGWSSGLLLATAILGLLITPQVFSSQTAIQRGVVESMTATRSRPQSFQHNPNSVDRNLIEWVRTLNVYPEPDAYTGQKVKVEGFVVHAPNLPPNYFIITRFVITCCAADAYPVGLPVKLSGDRTTYPADSWQEISGEMITETLDNKRQLVIAAQGIKKIPQPQNPFSY